MASICCNFAAIAYLLHCSVLTAQCSSWSSMHLGPISASLWQLLFTPCFSWRHFPSLVLIFLLQKPCCSHKYWKGLKKGENKWGGFIFAFCESPEPTWERSCKICFTSCLHFLPNRGIDSFQVLKELIWSRFSFSWDSNIMLPQFQCLIGFVTFCLRR